MTTLHCRSHCSFCRKREEGTCVKCLTVVPGGSWCSHCPGLSPQEQKSSLLSPHGQPAWSGAGKMPRAAGSHCMLGNSLGSLCFPELPFQVLGMLFWWVGFIGQGRAVPKVGFSPSQHAGIALLPWGREQAGLSSCLPRWSKLVVSFSAFLSSAESTVVSCNVCLPGTDPLLKKLLQRQSHWS